MMDPELLRIPEARKFWEAVFLAQVEYYRLRGWEGSSAACAAIDADTALKEWASRWISERAK
jgi:hypothetical protein